MEVVLLQDIRKYVCRSYCHWTWGLKVVLQLPLKLTLNQILKLELRLFFTHAPQSLQSRVTKESKRKGLSLYRIVRCYWCTKLLWDFQWAFADECSIHNFLLFSMLGRSFENCANTVGFFSLVCEQKLLRRLYLTRQT